MHWKAIMWTNVIQHLLISRARRHGLIDGTGTEEEILGQIRQLVSLLPSNFEDNDSFVECADDLNRTCDDLGCMCRRYFPCTFQNRR